MLWLEYGVVHALESHWKYFQVLCICHYTLYLLNRDKENVVADSIEYLCKIMFTLLDDNRANSGMMVSILSVEKVAPLICSFLAFVREADSGFRALFCF